jgi:hypothetical protein
LGSIDGILVPVAFLALLQGLNPPYPRPEATFWSAQTGDVKLSMFGGNSVQPFRAPPTRIMIYLDDPAKVAVFRRLIRARTTLPNATIDDPGDGEYYTMRNVFVAGYSTTIYGASHPGITLRVGVFHMKCGPPTCSTSLED